MDEAIDEREEELSSLMAIFPEIEIDANDNYTFSLEIHANRSPKCPLHSSDGRCRCGQSRAFTFLKLEHVLP
jgi:hypothetical protein